MLRKTYLLLLTAAVGLAMSAATVTAQQITRDYGEDEAYGEQEYDYDRARVDRYLSAEVWVNHSDGEYFEGDRIVVSYRANRDAFVVIYSIDTRGRVNLLFPAYPGEDNFVRGGVTYHLPSAYDDFDLVVSGPEGVENIQIIASRDRIPIPDWYPNSGLVADWDDRFDYMDYVNERYFVRYAGQRFAYDRTSIYVNEWEPAYFAPVFYPRYYPWTVCGNIYIDYPFGASIYIDGYYWGCAPLYIPRIYVGWHTITVYDHYGYCWENDFHVTRYNTVVLDHHHIRTSPLVASKYKEVRFSGYRDPVKNGYPNFAQKKAKLVASGAVGAVSSAKMNGDVKKKSEALISKTKKFTRGSSEVIKTKRGLESAGPIRPSGSEPGWSKGKLRGGVSGDSRSKGPVTADQYRGTKKATLRGGQSGSSESKGYTGSQKSTVQKKSSEEYYRKKSGSTYESKAKLRKSDRNTTKSTVRQKATIRKSGGTTKSTRNTGGKSYKSSGSSSKATGGSQKSSSTIRKSGGTSGRSGSSMGRSSGSAGKSSARSSGGSKRTTVGGKKR